MNQDEANGEMDYDEDDVFPANNSDRKCASRMVWTTATVAGAVSIGFHFCIFVCKLILSRIKGTNLDAALIEFYIPSLLDSAFLSIPSFLFGMFVTHRQSWRARGCSHFYISTTFFGSIQTKTITTILKLVDDSIRYRFDQFNSYLS
jgi:hypothetical protein